MSLLSLTTAKQWLQISHTAEDAALQIMLDAIEADVTIRTGAVFGSATYTEDLKHGNYLWPSYHPITSITSIKNNDTGEVLTGYEWREGGAGSKATNRIWRTTGYKFYCGTNPLVWRLVYTAGYTAQTVPAGLQGIIMDLLKRAYDNRGGKTSASAGGASYSWQNYLDTDALNRLHSYSFKTYMC
jgi:hypothetical protein